MVRQSKNTPKTLSVKKPRVDWGACLYNQIKEFGGIPLPELEHKFHPTRKWRFDMAFIKDKLAVEIEGAVWIQGRHTRGSCFVKDMEKYNEACFHGWTLARFTPHDVKTLVALKFLTKYFIGEQLIE